MGRRLKKMKPGYTAIIIFFLALVALPGCKDIEGSFRPESFGNTKEENQMVQAITEKYGDLTARGDPRLLEAMMTSEVVNFIPVDKVAKYSKDSENLIAWFVYDNFNNDEIEIEWKYLDEGHVIHTFVSRTGDNFGRGAFILEQPEAGWPLGQYQVRISARGVEDTISFEVIDGATISGPLDILSGIEDDEPEEAIYEEDGFGRVHDIEGNEYKTVTINSQEWMAENLRTTKYNDGTDIPYVTENSAWANLDTGAFCWYDNDESYRDSYGALYNWHAVNLGKLCPSGWRVPTDSDWKILKGTVDTQFGVDDPVWDEISSRSGSDAGQKLKSCRQANSPLGEDCKTTAHPRWAGGTHHGTDDYGFSAFAGGFRHGGGFANLGSNGYWWTATKHEVSANSAWSHNLWFGTDGAGRNSNEKAYGFSVRCIRD